MKNDDTAIGLSQGMFQNNVLTFSPGWNNNAKALHNYADVRDLQRLLKEQGSALISEAYESTAVPASFVAVNPDGNRILVDQHT